MHAGRKRVFLEELSASNNGLVYKDYLGRIMGVFWVHRGHAPVHTCRQRILLEVASVGDEGSGAKAAGTSGAQGAHGAVRVERVGPLATHNATVAALVVYLP